jgi:hypothetical protein
VQVTLRLDTSVLDKLRALGPGWQTRANAILGDGLAEYDGHRLKLPPADRRTVATGPVALA